MSEFSKRLSRVRKELGFTQTAFADELSMSARTYQAYEQGRTLPSCALLDRLSGFGVDLNWLVAGKGPQIWRAPEESAAAELDRTLFTKVAVAIEDGLRDLGLTLPVPARVQPGSAEGCRAGPSRRGTPWPPWGQLRRPW